MCFLTWWLPIHVSNVEVAVLYTYILFGRIDIMPKPLKRILNENQAYVQSLIRSLIQDSLHTIISGFTGSMLYCTASMDVWWYLLSILRDRQVMNWVGWKPWKSLTLPYYVSLIQKSDPTVPLCFQVLWYMITELNRNGWKLWWQPLLADGNRLHQ